MTEDEILSIAHESGFDYRFNSECFKIYDFAALVAEKERKECARVCEELRHPRGYSAESQDWVDGTNHCVDAIRERGETK